MNIPEKIYCRTFQAVLHTALPVLPYRKPKLLDSINEVPYLFRKKDIDRVLLITDPSIRKLGITRPLEDMLEKSGITCMVYDKTVANPTSNNVEAARQLFLKYHCQAIIGFGGGSSIDCAKATGARIAKPRQKLSHMKGILKVHKKLPLLVAIPTTAGTGSEATLAAVIVDSETRHKYPINDFPLIPHYAVLDPEVTRSLPPHVTATTGMDALTHAIEAYIGHSTTAETRADATEAVRLIFANLDRACRNGDDMKARRNMLHAAYLAGSAFSKSYVGYVHAVAHSLGGKYNVPHGLANAVLLPHVLEAYGEAAHEKLAELAIAAGLVSRAESAKDGAEAMIHAIQEMKLRLDIPDVIPEIQEKDIPALARIAAKEANPLYPVPVLMNASQLEQFYYDVMEVSA
ncbi:iron-containing alcohol dehydrogenase [Butyricicoccus sp.]|uniref:iron-containing alcohol dehydrogenase n=1 Tax=Butyricicoccus sp. TaxID=2049021 RepID=UPI003F148588